MIKTLGVRHPTVILRAITPAPLSLNFFDIEWNAMKALIVYAHPEPASFSAALKNTAVETLTRLGYQVVISDLYAMGWNPILSAVDFADRENGEFLDLSREQEYAFAQGTQSADVLSEQQKVADADLVLFHFPVWWFSMPAILKGWCDRVFSRGFGYAAGRKYDSGMFKGKQAMICLTTGTASTLYEPNGIDGDLLHVLWPIHNGILAYTGFTVLPPFSAWMPGRVTAEERSDYLLSYAERLESLDRAEPLFMHPWSDYDDTQRLKPGVAAKSGVQWNPSVGQSFVESADTFSKKQVK
ncbi:NAD(P)H-dependent oxidoreductase [Pseudomonas amygdali]|nr:NAD(P)H-dependent oxidoreductase [Pseudomonas amygdali]